jgi:autotransporter-associated beta strand protein
MPAVNLRCQSFLPASAVLGLVPWLTLASANATVVTINEANTTSVWTLPAGANLLNGSTANTPSAPATPVHGADTASSSWSVLTNNTVGAANNKLESVTPDNGSSVIFPLNVATNPKGYNLTQFDAYGGWPDSGRDNLDFTVYYSTVAAPATFIQLAVVSNHTTVENSTHTRLTDTTGVLASGVYALKFLFGSPTGQESGYVGYREFIALGTAVPAGDPLTWTGSSGSGGNATWTAAADSNWEKTADGSAATFNPLSPLTFDDTGINPAIMLSPDAISAGSLAFTQSGGTDYSFGGQPLMVTNDIVLSGGGHAAFGNAVAATHGVTLSGTGGLAFNAPLTSPSVAISGAGSVALNAANPGLSGSLSVIVGGLNFGDNGAAGTATLSLSGGVANFTTAAPSLAGLIGTGGAVVLGNTANPVAPQLTVGSAASTSFAGSITQAAGDVGRLTKTGTGTLSLSGDNTYTGATSVIAGSLEFAQRMSLYHGQPASWTSANLLAGSGATLGFKAGGTGEFTESDLTALGIGGMASGSNLAITTSADLTLSRVLNRPISLQKKGTSTLILTGANTHSLTTLSTGTLKLANPSGTALTGNTQVGDGTADVWLNMGANNQFGANSVLTFADGTANGKFQLRGTSQTVAGLESAAGSTLSIVQNDETGTPGYTTTPGAASLTVNAAAGTQHIFQGLIRTQNGGALTLIKNGAGTQEFRSVPASPYGYSGTTVNAGILKLNLAQNWTSNIAVAAGATLNLDGGYSHSGTISGAGKVVKDGTGNVTLVNNTGYANANSYAGGTTINAGTLTFSADPGSTGEGTAPGQNCLAGTMLPSNIVTVKSGATLAIGGASALGNSGLLPQYAPTIKIEPGGKLSGGAGNNLAFLANVNLDGAAIQVTDGSTAGGFNTNIALVGTVVVGGTSNTLSTISTTGSGANATVSLGSYGLQMTTFQVADVTGSAAPDLTISSVLCNVKDAGSSLIKTGAGTLLLQGANTYTGVTSVLEGTLAVSGNSIADGSQLFLNGGKVSIAAGINETVDSLFFGAAQQVAGTYGSSSSSATYRDDAHFSGTGILTVNSGSVDAWFAPNSFSFSPTAILRWSSTTDTSAPYNISQVPLAARMSPPTATGSLRTLLNVNPNAQPGQGKVEALIAFGAGASQGVRSTRFYAPTVWQYMDILGDWGGAVASITVPPGHVVDAAHRNGVPVLGNVFLAPVQYGGNIAHVNEFLIQRADGSFPVADKMIEAARYFKFDGWFINMETGGGNSTTASTMQAFLKYCKAQAPELHMSWYDALISDGSVSWQRRLDSANQGFFQAGGARVSDSMFLDFYWGGGNAISSSASLAQSLGRSPYDVYAGIDTEGAGDNGSNTFGGPIDWEQLFPTGQAHRASLGIYRPEWTFNYSGNPADAINRETRYWSGQNSDPSNTSIPSGSGNPNWPGIAKFIPAKSPLTTLPFITNFSIGQGNRFTMDGVVKSTGDWTNLSLQDVLPTWKWIVSSAGTKLTPVFDYDTAFYGGTSLKVSGTLTAGQPNEIKLYQASLPVTASTSIRLVYKPSAATAAQVEVGYAFEDTPTTMNYTTVGASSSTNWITVDTSIGGFAGKKLALITLRFTTASTLAGYQVNIGRLQVSNTPSAAPAPPSTLVLEGHARNPDEAFGSQLRLSWTPSPDPVLQYNVYYRPDLSAANDSKRVFLGATPNHYFFASDVRRFGLETSGYIQVEAVGPGYAVSTSISTVQPTFNFEPFPDLTHPVITSYPLPAPLTVISSTTNATNIDAFDNSILTTTEPGTYSGEWLGLDLGAGNAKQITAIRFVPRATLAVRMVNGVFQGSNTADFSSGVVELARVNYQPPDNLETTLLVSNSTAFRYLRYVSPDFGYCNLAELKFYTTGSPVPETPPVNLQGTVAGTLANLTWSAPYVGVPYSYNVKRSTVPGGPYATLATGLTTTSWQDSGLATGAAYYYVVTTNNGGGESANSAQLTLNPPPLQKLTGTVIGGGTPNAANTGYVKAFDGSFATYFEASASSVATGWTGLDLGAGNAKPITAIRYCPRSSDTSNTTYADLLLGGCFQASNTADFSSGVTTFIALNSRAAYNTLTSVAVNPSATPYRYLRYLGSSARIADIAEVEFYGGAAPAVAPSNVMASALDATATVSWSAVPGATGYKVSRSATSGGPYQVVSANAPGLSFIDTGLNAGNTYYYVVSALNASGAGPASVEVSAFDAYARWLTDAGQTPGAANSGFDQDANGDGVKNGVEYMIPTGLQVLPASTGSSGVTAILRQDPAVTVRLWSSTDLTNWTQVDFADASDQSGLDPGFHRVESVTAPLGDQPRTFYRFDFTR